MAQCLLNVMTGGVSKSLLEQVTAGAADILKDKVIVDKNGNPLTGTMPNNGSWDTEVGIGASVTIPKGYHDGTGVAKNSTTNRGAWNGTVAVNGSVTIPQGYHNGSGKVSNSTPTMGGQTITPTSSTQTVSCSGKYMTGNIVINAANIFKTQSGSVTASSSKISFTKQAGGTASAYYWELSLSGWRNVVGVSWTSTDVGGYAQNGFAQLLSTSPSVSTNFTGNITVTATYIRLPSGMASRATVYYRLFGY